MARPVTGHYAYPLTRIRVEEPVVIGRDATKKADIIITDAKRPDVLYAVVEVKQVKAKDGKEQLRSYTNATGAPLAVWSRGVETIVWNRKDPNFFVEIPALPSASQTIASVVDQPWTVADLVRKEEDRNAKRDQARTLRDLIVDLENEVLANAGVDVFEEVFKLVFIKLFDELETHRGAQTHLRFRNNDTAAEVRAALTDLFDRAKRKWPGVFAADERLRLSPEHLQICVGSLEEWKLFNSNLDVIDDAFEYLVNKTSKGEKGQYFTPRWVIDMCVKMLDPKEDETVIDTAAGSAGFTVHAMFHVWRKIMDELDQPQSHLFTMDQKPPRCTDYVRDKVFAVDFDEKSVRRSALPQPHCGRRRDQRASPEFARLAKLGRDSEGGRVERRLFGRLEEAPAAARGQGRSDLRLRRADGPTHRSRAISSSPRYSPPTTSRITPKAGPRRRWGAICCSSSATSIC